MANENMEGMTPEAEENVSGTAAEESHAGNSNNDAGAEGDGHEAGAEDRDFADNKEEDGGEGAAEEDGKPESPKKTDKPEQTPEERRENARKRREMEEAVRIKAATDKARVQAILDVTGGINPYNNEPMKDAQDVAVYERMRRIEKDGGDPVRDYAKAMAADEREAEATRVQAEDTAKWYRDDLAAFEMAYPDVDAGALLADPEFNEYAEAQVKAKVPLAKIYGGYERLREKFAREAEAKVKAAQDGAAQALANARAGVGGKSADPAGAGEVFFTKAQVDAMSEAEIARNQDAIWKSMQKW